MLFIPKKDVESCQTAVNFSDVLLQVDFFGVAELSIAVDALFEYAQAVAGHHDFVEKIFDGQLLGLEAFVGGLQDQGAAFPTVANGYFFHAINIGAQDFNQRFFGSAETHRIFGRNGFHNFHFVVVLAYQFDAIEAETNVVGHGV